MGSAILLLQQHTPTRRAHTRARATSNAREWCGSGGAVRQRRAAQLPLGWRKEGWWSGCVCYGMAAKQACLPKAGALPGRAVRVLCGPRCFRCVLTKTSLRRTPIQLWPANPLVSRPRPYMTKSLHHQHHFSQPHPFCTRFPASFPPTSRLPAFILHFCPPHRVRPDPSSPSTARTQPAVY